MPFAFVRSTVTSFVVAALLAAPVAACRNKTPDESTVLQDAATPVATLQSLLPFDGAAPKLDGGRPELHDFCGDIYAADSAHMVQVCSAKDMGVAQGVARAASQLCTDDTNAALARNRVTFDHDAAKGCIQMLQGAPLVKASEVDTIFAHFPCDRVLIGLQDEGQPCRFSIECKDALACVDYAQGKDGTCAKPPKAGEVCTGQRFGNIINEAAAEMHHPACAPGAWCDGSKCQTRVGKGKTCAGNTKCDSGLMCVMGKCASPSANGGKCFASQDCVYGSWCDKSSGGSVGVCSGKRPAGAECPEPDACKGRCDSTPSMDAGVAKAGHCIGVCGSG